MWRNGARLKVHAESRADHYGVINGAIACRVEVKLHVRLNRGKRGDLEKVGQFQDRRVSRDGVTGQPCGFGICFGQIAIAKGDACHIFVARGNRPV